MTKLQEALRLSEEAFMKIADLRNLGKIQPEVIAFEALYTIRAARAREQAEQDLDTCPGCGGVADNGHDREFPPNPYYCTKCSEQAEQEPVAYTNNDQLGYLKDPLYENAPMAMWSKPFDERVNVSLYAAPVRTKDLTDDEIDRIACNVSHKEFARAVIAADRSKNGIIQRTA